MYQGQQGPPPYNPSGPSPPSASNLYGAPPGQGSYGQQPPAYGQSYGQQPTAPSYGQTQGVNQPYGGAPPVDSTVQSWFVAVDQDHSGKITCNELRAALTNGNWSHFNEETCRLMINMFDRDHSGTIDLQEFSMLWQYLNSWKGCFEQYDRNRSGNIDHQELLQAFVQMGYNVSPQFVSHILRVFDRKAARNLKFDDFIQACVMMKNLTDAFRQRDTSLTGTVQMNYEDFMSLALLNKA